MKQYDLPGLYLFLSGTPEAGLRKLLVDGHGFSDTHFHLLMKWVRHCSESEFCEHLERGSWPKIKLGPQELKIKEHFWNDCFLVFQKRGILNPAQSKKDVA